MSDTLKTIIAFWLLLLGTALGKSVHSAEAPLGNFPLHFYEVSRPGDLNTQRAIKADEVHRHDCTLEGVVCHGDPVNKVDVLGLASVLVDTLPGMPDGMPDGMAGLGGGNGGSIGGSGEHSNLTFRLGLFEGTSSVEWARIDALNALDEYVAGMKSMQRDIDYFNAHFAPAPPSHPSSRPGRVGLDGILYELAGAPEGIINFAFQDVLMGPWASSVAVFDGNGYDGFGRDVSRAQGGLELAFWLIPGFIDDVGRFGMGGQRFVANSGKIPAPNSVLRQGGGLSDLPLARTRGLGATSTTDDLLRTGAIPGSEGVILTQKTVKFDDIWKLSQRHHVEFLLFKKDGQFVLRSGAWGSVKIPRGIRPIAHSHPTNAFGVRRTELIKKS